VRDRNGIYLFWLPEKDKILEKEILYFSILLI